MQQPATEAAPLFTALASPLQGTAKVWVGGCAENTCPSAHREPEAALQPSGDGAGPGPLLCSAGMQPSIPAGFPHCWPSSPTPTYGPHTHRDRLGYPDPKTPAGIVVWLFSKADWKSPILYHSPYQACAGSERVKSTAICSYISLLKS